MTAKRARELANMKADCFFVSVWSSDRGYEVEGPTREVKESLLEYANIIDDRGKDAAAQDGRAE